MTRLIQQHHGRVVDSPGDNLLAEFASVVDAVRCAVAIQEDLKTKNAELPEQRQMQFRIGINLGDVIVEGERLYGDGVNIAARLESLADAGGICISGKVFEEVETKLALNYEYLGEQTVKNIAKPVRVYRVATEILSPLAAEDQLQSRARQQAATASLPDDRGSDSQPSSPGKSEPKSSKPWRMMGAVSLLLIAGVIIGVRYFSFLTPSLQPPIPNTQPPLSTQDSALRTQAPQALALPDKPSLVVLPFVNMSGDPGQEYFSDGMTEDLTTALTRVSGLFVISRNSAFTYKGKAVNVKEVSRELGVRHVVEGSVQKAGDRVRINAQLVDATTGHHVWAERYDRELKDIFTLQDEVIQKIVFALKVKLTAEEQARFKRFPTDNLEAYDFFLRGAESFYRSTKEANAQARQMFEKALELDPQYAGAYAWLGWTYFYDWLFQWSLDPQNLERAFELAQRARALDDSVPEAHQLLSWVYLWMKNQPEQALAEAERAITLDPNYADSYAILANVLSIVGRPQEAIGVAEKAVRLDPRGPGAAGYLYQLGVAYQLTGRLEEAIATLKQALMHDPNFQFAYTNLAGSYVWQWGWQLSQDPQGLEQAFEAAQKALALNDSFLWAHAALGAVYLSQKQHDRARAEAERAIALDPNLAVGYMVLAAILNATGKLEEALGVAEKAVHLDSSNPLFLFELGQAYCLSGRHEEALATLQKFLTHYPNLLHAQLFLASAYSEAGREEEARAAAAEVLRISPTFSLEVMKQRAPDTDPAVIERQVAALRKAGLK